VFTGIDKPDAADPTKKAYTPYRYNAKRWDAQSGTSDTGFRDYAPGLNRFIMRNMYTGALAGMGLGVDPCTGNRYTFGGGNPSSFVELDEHMLAPVGGGGGSRPTLEKEKAQPVDRTVGFRRTPSAGPRAAHGPRQGKRLNRCPVRSACLLCCMPVPMSAIGRCDRLSSGPLVGLR
jgi:RHS repeat-associated protein